MWQNTTFFESSFIRFIYYLVTISYWCKVGVALLCWEAEEQRGGGRFSGSPDPGVSSINARQCNHQHAGMSQLLETFRRNTGVGSKSIPT